MYLEEAVKTGTKDVLRAKEFANLAGVTVRALHHYDRLGLLRPRQRSQAWNELFFGVTKSDSGLRAVLKRNDGALNFKGKPQGSRTRPALQFRSVRGSRGRGDELRRGLFSLRDLLRLRK
jgi:MerR family regulatory protein